MLNCNFTNSRWKKLIAPHFNPEAITDIHLIHTGGSDRRFYRLTAEENSFILQETGNMEEFRDYRQIGSFLREKGVNVPRIIAVDDEAGILIMEDAGKADLYSVTLPLLKKADDGSVLETYEKVIDALTGIQKIPLTELPPAVTSRRFDFPYYRWETDYFIDNCIGIRFGISDFDRASLIKEMESLAESLANEPLVMVHRDFQSQNIYLKDGAIVFLDFQSSRLGSIFYDIASLLKDPYVELPAEIQRELLEYYLSALRDNRLMNLRGHGEVEEIYNRVALQRLMQALGAYGNLGINKGKTAFLQYIPPALRMLKQTLMQTDGFGVLKELVIKIADSV